MKHTIENLEEFSDTNVSDPSSIVTQWINSLTGILTLAYEPLLDKKKVRTIKISDDRYAALGMPEIYFIAERSEHPCDFLTLEHMLTFIRNGLAHGNTELLVGHWLKDASGPVITSVINVSPVGVAIWNEYRKNGTVRKKPPLVLDFSDIVCLVHGLSKMCEDRTYWNDDALAWSGEQVIDRYGVLPARLDIVIRIEDSPEVSDGC